MTRRIFGTKREEITRVRKIKIEQLHNWHFNKRVTVINLRFEADNKYVWKLRKG
jgi:hypothetical protein